MKYPLALFISIFFIMGCQKSSNTTNTNSNTNTTVVAHQLKFIGNGFIDNGTYPKLYTCDSTGISPGLSWSNAPSTTNSYAVIMYTIPPAGPSGPSTRHAYIVLYNIPPTISAIPDNSKSIGLWGINTVDGKNTYTPPCSQGPGAKIYVLTLYALSAAPTFTVPQSQVTMELLYASLKNKIVDSAVMSVTYTRP